MQPSKFLFEINVLFRPVIVRKRREFMNLVLQIVSKELDNPQASDDLMKKFGTRLITSYNDGTSLTVIEDGETIFKR